MWPTQSSSKSEDKPMRYFPRLTLAALFAAQPIAALDFVHEVLPILREKCAECHTGGKKKGGLAMNTRAELLKGGSEGSAVIPGSAEGSLMLKLVTSIDEDERMPPKGPRLEAKQIAVLREWIDSGLPWEAGITLGKSGWEPPLEPRAVQLPPATNSRKHPIDRLLDAGLAKRNESLPPPTSDKVFFRRASLDTVGLLPSPDKLEEFAQDKNPDKREKLVEALLADDIAYADHWFTTWNDLLRNDYTGTGFITGGRKQITTWLYKALRENKPYDLLVRELIAPSPESAGFINGIKWRGNVNASQTIEIQFAQNISQVFLGINMKCASCHDSFIDRWTLEEAYSLASIYASSPLEIYRCDKPTGKTAAPKWIFPELGDVDPKASKEERLKQLADLMTHPKNGRFPRTVVNRIWHRLMGRGIVHPVDAMHTKPWDEDLLDYLANRFVEDGYDLKAFIKFVMDSQAYQSRTVLLEEEPGEDYAYAGPIAKRMTAEQLMDSIWQVTGTNPSNAEAKVDRSVKRTEPELLADTPIIREVPPQTVEAQWIWHPTGASVRKTKTRTSFTLSGLPSKGRLMATCDNAFRFKLNGQEVAYSKDWQKPVYVDVTKYLAKGENHIEVDAEMFGGAAGFIAQLSILEGGAVKNLSTGADWEVSLDGKTWEVAKVVAKHGDGPWGKLLDPSAKESGPMSSGDGSRPIRAALVKNDFLMRSLGRPHRDQVVTTRPSELTTLQAIDLSNGEILAGYLAIGARNLSGQGKSARDLATWLYQFALSRAPTQGELSVMTEVAGEAKDPVAIEDLLWMVFMQPEFQIVR